MKATVYLKGRPPIVIEPYKSTNVLTGEGKALTPTDPYLPIDVRCSYSLISDNKTTLCFAGSELQAIHIEE
ncbi:MAG: hypothetical protein IJS96_08895 [Schwartzia sp.]|nr:hypothetical protein [Schwartzia sp. (in: firmicutes)]